MVSLYSANMLIFTYIQFTHLVILLLKYNTFVRSDISNLADLTDFSKQEQKCLEKWRFDSPYLPNEVWIDDLESLHCSDAEFICLSQKKVSI